MKSSLVWVVLSQLKQGLLWLFSDKRVSNFPLDSLTPNKTFCEQNIFWQSDKKLFVCFVFRFKDVFSQKLCFLILGKRLTGKKFLFAAKTTLVKSPSSSSSPSTISNLFQRVKLLYRRKSVRFLLRAASAFWARIVVEANLVQQNV